MQNRIAIPFLLFGLFMFNFAEAQVKIGDNPQVIDPASILELESSDKVLVITRVDSLQMTTIVPNRGALVYNTTADCVFYYDGTQWINMCGATGDGPNGPLTANPIVNDISTIVITPTANGDNFEVAPNSINSEQIVNGGVNGVDIQDGSIGQGKLQDNSVTQDKLSENSVGAFAIDNDNIDLGDFTNNAGFITGADIISADPGNVLTDSNGAFYNDSGLQTAIAANTTAIAADNDQNATNEIQSLSILGDQLTLTGANTITIPTANGSDTQIINGNNTTVTGSGIVGDEYRINVADQADPSITNELTDLDFDIGTNILSLTNGATVAGSSVNLSSLAGGGGTDNQNLTLTGNILEIEDGNTVDFTPILGGGGTDNQNLTLTGNILEIEDGNTVDFTPILGAGDDNQTAAEVPFTATGNTVSTDVQNAIVELQGDIDGLSAGGEPNTASNQGAGGIGLTLPKDMFDLPFKSLNAGDSGIISVTDDTANDEVDIDIVPAAPLTPAEDQMLITNGTTDEVEWAPLTGHTGTSKGIFFADENGDPAQAFNPDNGELSLIWDYEGRVPPGTTRAYGVLGIGLDGGTISNEVKVHIAEELPGKLSYPLEIQNRTNNEGDGSSTGLLFSVDGTNAHGKGALAFERTDPWGVGDFHFLQNLANNSTNPTLTDKSFSILSNKDIQLYGNLIDKNGVGATQPPPAAEEGLVLTNTATGARWAPSTGGAISSNVSTFTGDGTVGDPLNIALSAINEDMIEDGEVTFEKIRPAVLAATPVEQVLVTQTDGTVAWRDAVSGTGETNTGANVGTAGIGTFANKNLAELQFKNINTVDPLVITVTDDAANNEIDIDLANEAVTTAKIRPAVLAATPIEQVLVTQTDGTVAWRDATTGTGETNTAANIGTTGVGTFANKNLAELQFKNINTVDPLVITVTDDAANNEIDIDLANEAVTTAKIRPATLAATPIEQVLVTQTDGTVAWRDATTGTGETNTGANVGTAGVGTFANKNLAELRFKNINTVDPLVITVTDDAANNEIDIDLANEAVTTAKIRPATLAATPIEQVLVTQTDGTVAWRDATTGTGETNTGANVGTAGVGTFANKNLAELRFKNINGAPSGIITVTDDPADNEIDLDIAIDAITPAKIQESQNPSPTGQVLTTDASGDVVWAAPAGVVSGTSGSIFFADTDGSVTENNTELFWDNTNDRLGVGVVSPSASIHTNGSVRVQQGLAGNNATNNEPKYTNTSESNTGMYRGNLVDYLRFATGGTEAMTINPSQNVGIGINTPAEKLHVIGNILATGTITSTGDITTSGDLIYDGVITDNVPDYVFQKYFLGTSSLNENYDFKSLEEIEAFVQKNHHLPGITSAVQAKKDGSWNISKSNLQNLEKIEELYLHTINQEKEINKLKSEKETLSKELMAIKQDLEEIKALLKK